jgi:hypothetical protein
LSSEQKNHSKSQTHVHCCLQLNYLKKKTKVDALLEAESKKNITSTINKFKRTDEKYDGLLMCDLELFKNLRSEIMMSRPQF